MTPAPLYAGATGFGQFLVERWAELRLVQADFCRLVEMPDGWVAQIRTGRKSMPYERVEAWADALQLTGRRRRLFLDLAATTHLPDAARPRFERLVAKDTSHD